jgi:hypothetical protein
MFFHKLQPKSWRRCLRRQRDAHNSFLAILSKLVSQFIPHLWQSNQPNLIKSPPEPEVKIRLTVGKTIIICHDGPPPATKSFRKGSQTLNTTILREPFPKTKNIPTLYSTTPDYFFGPVGGGKLNKNSSNMSDRLPSMGCGTQTSPFYL